MSELLICNAIPTYKTAPVSLDILKNTTSEILESIYSKKAEKNYIILEKDQSEIEEIITKELGNFKELTLEIKEADDNVAFVYLNESAAVKILEGEKPIPLSKDDNNILFTVEQLLNKEVKTVYVEGKIKKSGKHVFSKKLTPKEIIETCGADGEVKGIFLGFPEGRFIGQDKFDEVIELKSDLIRVFNEKNCMLTELNKTAQEFIKESCGRCVFGFEGVTQINRILADIIRKKGKITDISKLQNLCNQMRHQTVCNVDPVLATVVETALENFHDEITEHITKKTCKAAVCSSFVTYHILASKCTGCMECIDSCDDDAIMSKRNFVHVIDQSECIQCGACVDACEYGAIVKAGATKPKCPPKPIPCRRKK